MNWTLILFFVGIMIGMFIGVQPIISSMFEAILGVLKNHKTKKKNRGMF